VPAELTAIVEKAMARDAVNRHASGAELAAALKPWAKDWDPKAYMDAVFGSTLNVDASVAIREITKPPTTQAAVSFDVAKPAKPSRPRAFALSGALIMAGVAAVAVGVSITHRDRPDSSVVRSAASTPHVPPEVLPATPPHPEPGPPIRVSLRFIGPSGVNVSLPGSSPCTTPCAIDIDRTNAPITVAFTSTTGQHWTQTTSADSAHDVELIEPPAPIAPTPAPAAPSHTASAATHAASTHRQRPPIETHPVVTNSRPEPHIEMNQ
jgi:hypothetical protein